MIIIRTTRLPCPVWLSRDDRLSRLPRGEIRWSTIAKASGKASEPSARNAPALPIIVPNQNGCSGTTAIGWSAGAEPVAALESFSGRMSVVDGVSSRLSSDGAQIGARPGRRKPYNPSALTGDLHQAQRRIEQERRHDAPQTRYSRPSRSAK